MQVLQHILPRFLLGMENNFHPKLQVMRERETSPETPLTNPYYDTPETIICLFMILPLKNSIY